MLIRLNVIDNEGKKTVIDAKEGTTIRQAIMDNLAPSMYGLCGGECICGTCHIYVSSEDLKKLEKIKENELETLQTSDIEQKENSRLGCQIQLKNEHNNITVTLAQKTSTSLAQKI
tara:strand:+ start:102 stop:449 length:348 start_codon:yes stop_codon:yes gene_type:complete